MPVKKSAEEKEIEDKYNSILQYMKEILGNESTFSNDLETVGYKLFGSKFKGVFPSDKIPQLDSLKRYAIINLDNSKQPGSHWIAIAYDDSDDSLLVYDSFGRKSTKIIPNLNQLYGGRFDDTDYDAEQRIKEDNCGQRSLAWLMVYDKMGKQSAKKI